MAASQILLAQHEQHLPLAQLFERRELVGKGAYGGVYKATHIPTGTVIAIKVIDLDTPDDDISEIQKEVALLSELRDAARHNITLYHGCYLNGSELWIAMDFASGGSIRTLMKSGPIDEKYIVLIVREVLVALAFLHRQNIIHRDVKAANILLTQVGKILLCDFGVAAHLQTNNKRSTFIGTPLWMAPEVITDGKLYDTKADIWSLGVTLFEIATGNPPYFGMEPLRACALIPRSPPAKLEGGPWSAGLRDFLGLCLMMEPGQRPSAEELGRSKWIKSAAKVSMTLLRELIVRYVGWIQMGGQRTSLAGLEGLHGGHREDTFDIEEDRWDFDDGEDEEVVEPLGDEPPRSLDAQAAISNVRPPKPPNFSRSHPLLRLFDASTNPYAAGAPPSAATSFSTGISSLDTVRPTISIPSFEEMDEMSSASTPSTKFMDMALSESRGGFSPTGSAPPSAGGSNSVFNWGNGGGLPQDSKSSFSTASSSGGSASPRLVSSRSQTPDPWGAGDPWSGSTTPTEASFPSNLHPVTSSPSLPSMTAFDSGRGGSNRPFTPSRRRADTAPSFEPPPFAGFASFSSTSSNNNSPFGGLSLAKVSSPASVPYGLPTPSHSANPSLSSSTSSSVSVPANGAPEASPPMSSRPFGFEKGDVNRPFRERKGSEANGLVGGTGSRSRAASESRTNRTGLKVVTGAPPDSGSESPGTFTPTATSFPFSTTVSPVSPSIDRTPLGPPSTISPPSAFPFPNASVPDPPPEPWPTGPPLGPLDYAKLVTSADVHEELERTIGELEKWLVVVEGGLGRILRGTDGLKVSA